MEEKLDKLYRETIFELEKIGIRIENNPEIGTIDIKLSKRNNKRYCQHRLERFVWQRTIKKRSEGFSLGNGTP